MAAKINPVQSMPTRQRAVARFGTMFVKIEDLASIKRSVDERTITDLSRFKGRMKYSDNLRDKIGQFKNGLTESTPERTRLPSNLACLLLLIPLQVRLSPEKCLFYSLSSQGYTLLQNEKPSVTRR